MNETVYASDLCKLYLENYNVMNSNYRDELYKQIYGDLFGYMKNEFYSSIICSYTVDYFIKYQLIKLNIIEHDGITSMYVTYSELKAFNKYSNLYYNPKCGYISIDFYENLMKKIEMLNLK